MHESFPVAALSTVREWGGGQRREQGRGAARSLLRVSLRSRLISAALSALGSPLISPALKLASLLKTTVMNVLSVFRERFRDWFPRDTLKILSSRDKD